MQQQREIYLISNQLVVVGSSQPSGLPSLVLEFDYIQNHCAIPNKSHYLASNKLLHSFMKVEASRRHKSTTHVSERV